MRERWMSISTLWEENKTPANKLDLLDQLNYYGKLSSQLDWQEDQAGRPVRVIYGGWGAPTAALLLDNKAIVDYKLFWVACRNLEEAHYLLAIINSNALAEAVNKYTTPNWAGNTRDLQNHLWKLPIPLFNNADPVHAAISEAGRLAREGAAEQLLGLKQERNKLTVTVARREIRKWLRESKAGKTAERAAEDLLNSSQRES